MRKISLSFAALLFTSMVAAGCATGDIIRADYVQSDRATYEAVTPEYLNYVHGDAKLDSEEKTRRERTVTTWRLRLEQAEKPVEVAPVTSAAHAPSGQ